MTAPAKEVARRTTAALAAVRSVFGTPEDEHGVTLFVSHHLEEIGEAYWQKHLGTSQPDPERVLDILELHAHWDEEDDDGIDTFDFTLPEEATNYVVSVRFNECIPVLQDSP
jgi:hypothetical protein